MPKVIRFDNVTKRFTLHQYRPRSLKELALGLFQRDGWGLGREEIIALDKVSFEVEQGETLGIIGPNGAGKSTILKLITRIIEPTSGRITTSGRVAALLELGTGFHPDLTGRENIYLTASLLGLSRQEIEARFADIVDFSGLERFIDMPVKYYSSGMFVRLGFAVAAHLEADILLVDEVLAVGDETFRAKCLDKINSYIRQGGTLLFVSHQLNLIESVCDRVLLIYKGKLVKDGKPKEIEKLYQRLLSEEEDHISFPTKKDRASSGRIVITEVELLNERGESASLFAAGDTMIVRLSYQANAPVRDPLFQVRVWRGDQLCHGTNTDRHNIQLGEIRGSGTLEIRYENLPLLRGDYHLSIAVYPNRYSKYTPCDKIARCCPFKIVSNRKMGAGMVFIPHHWVLPEQEGREEGPGGETAPVG